MEKVIVELVIALARVLPGAIDAIIKSTTLTDAEKHSALVQLSAELALVRAQVAAVKFKTDAELAAVPPDPGDPD